jgi:hypothetical protein
MFATMLPYVTSRRREGGQDGQHPILVRSVRVHTRIAREEWIAEAVPVGEQGRDIAVLLFSL